MAQSVRCPHVMREVLSSKLGSGIDMFVFIEVIKLTITKNKVIINTLDIAEFCNALYTDIVKNIKNNISNQM